MRDFGKLYVMGIFVTNDVAFKSFQNDRYIDLIQAKLAVTLDRLASRSPDHDGVQLNAVVCSHAGSKQVSTYPLGLGEK